MQLSPSREQNHREATGRATLSSASQQTRQQVRIRDACAQESSRALEGHLQPCPVPLRAPVSGRAHMWNLMGVGEACASSARAPCHLNVGRLGFSLPDSPSSGATASVTATRTGWDPVPTGSHLQPHRVPPRRAARPPCLPGRPPAPPPASASLLRPIPPVTTSSQTASGHCRRWACHRLTLLPSGQGQTGKRSRSARWSQVRCPFAGSLNLWSLCFSSRVLFSHLA